MHDVLCFAGWNPKGRQTSDICVQAAETYIFNLKNIKAIKVMYTHVHPDQSAPPYSWQTYSKFA